MNLVVGHGLIGQAVGKLLGDYEWTDRDMPAEGKYDVLHICFPYSEGFETFVKEYIKKHSPKYTIVYSTVPIGTCKGLNVVHSPVEGNHPNLDMGLRFAERWVGYNTFSEGRFFNKFFKDIGLKVKLIKNSDHTEALKLLSTTEYGLNIEFARYKAHVARSIGMNYRLTKEWNQMYNNLYEDLQLPKYQKFILDEPIGPKGGHCVVPNARILQEQFPNKMVREVAEL